LVGYEKTSTLAAGASEVVTVTVPGKEFASYDSNNAKTYVLTSGDYYLTIGNGAHDAVNNILAAQGYTSGSKLVGTGNADLAKVALSQKNVDKTTYSTAVTGEKITNLFDDSDLNKYSETKSTGVTYINRSNWEGTVVLDPLDNNTNYTKITMTQNMLNDFRSGWDGSMLKEDDVAYPTYGQSAGLNLIDMRVDSDGNEIPYDSEIWDTFMDQLTWDDTVSLLSEGMRMTAGLESIGKPATLDHNGPLGVTQNYASGVNGLAYKNGVDSSEKSSTFPCMFIFAGSFNKDLETRVGENYGENCLWAGYSGLYGPGMNIHRSQYSCRNAEYYSEDGFLSGVTAAHQIKGIQSKGVYVYIKHFALNDQETHRYGLSTWLNEQSFREIYLKPFEISIQEGGAHAMMSSYNRVGTKVAAVSSNLVTDWLRGEQGFDGFVVTDMYQTSTYYSLTFYMGMVQMPAAVLSGNDLVDGSITSAGQFDAYKTGYGELANAMRTSCKRILYTCVHSSAMNGWSSTTKLVKVQTSWQIGLLASEITLGILAAASLGFFGYCFYDKNLKKKKED
jgi:beta-glucosidase